MRPIGVFDSGIGGLTVVKELMRQMPEEDIVYLGDTAHLPYGTKSPSTVIRFTLDNILFLLGQKAKLIIIACNTASSLALDTIAGHFQVPIMGVIQPGAEEAARVSKTRCIGVIGTRATINSKAYQNHLKRIDPLIRVESLACPLFVPLVEEGWLNQAETLAIARKYLGRLRKGNKRIDTLILGCTHYPLLKPVISKVLGGGVRLVDSARQVVRDVGVILREQGLKNSKSRRRNRSRFYVTDDPDEFAKQAVRFLGYRLDCVRKIEG